MVTKLNSFGSKSLALALTIIGANSAFARNPAEHYRFHDATSQRNGQVALKGAVSSQVTDFDFGQHFRLLNETQKGQRKAALTAAANSPYSVNSSVQPFVCIDSSTTNGGTFAAFTRVANRFSLLAKLDGPLDQVGLVVNLPSGTPATTVSFEVAPNHTSKNLYIAIGGNYITPSGMSGTFRSDNIPNSIFGNKAKNRNLQYNFNLLNLINGVGNVPIPAGSKLTFLLIDVEELFPALAPGSVLIDNVIVNGHAVAHKDVTPVGTCPIPF